MTSLAQPNLTVTFDPALPEQWRSLREYVAFRVQEQRLNAANLAGKMDLSPSVLSRKLNQPDSDKQRFNVDDLEAYIQATGDAGAVIAYLVAKYVENPDARRERALTRVEDLSRELTHALELLKGAAK